MTVCKFWKTGSCKFGNSCRFEHPPNLRGVDSGQKQDAFMRPPQEQDQNRFGQSNRNNNYNNQNQNQNQNSNHNQNFSQNNQRYSNQQQSRGFRDYRGNRGGRDPQPYGVTREILQEDLRERPNWIMSAYGPGKDPDIQLFGGYPLEHSPEEVRLLHYQAMASGNPEASSQVEAELATISNEQVDAVLKDLSGALHYLANGSKEHPNRSDICKAGTSNIKRNGDGPFSKQTRHREINEQRRKLGSGFGQQQAGVGFASQQPGFGAAPPPQQQQQQQQPNPVFGAASNPGFNTGFGSQAQTSFAQQPQPSQFGAPQNTAFGLQPQSAGFAPSDQPMASPQMGQGNPNFGMANGNPNFAQPPQQQQQPQPMNSMFGQPQMQQQPSPFSNAPQQQQQQQQPNPSPFGAAPPNQQMQQPFATGFGQQPQQVGAPTGMNGFQQQQQQQPNGPGGPPNGDVNSYTTRDASDKLLTWKGRPVNYLNPDEPCFQHDDGSWERIWFPDGQPPTSPTKDNQASAFADVGQYPSDTKEQFSFLSENGALRGGFVPKEAPLAEMVRWDI